MTERLNNNTMLRMRDYITCDLSSVFLHVSSYHAHFFFFFFFGCAGSLSLYEGFSSCRALALELSSPLVVCWLGYSEAFEILTPLPGIELTSPALEGGFLTTGLSGKSPHVHF